MAVKSQKRYPHPKNAVEIAPVLMLMYRAMSVGKCLETKVIAWSEVLEAAAKPSISRVRRGDNFVKQIASINPG
jgi:hypothetical protein